jgi:NTP pyrophosphatase (non-canonical NTP hydrolase)
MDINGLSEDLEQISKAYAEKFNIERNASWFVLKLQEEVGELIQSYLMLSGQARTKGKSPNVIHSAFKSEVADVFCHPLLLARFYGVDIESEVQKKWLQWGHS